MKYLGIDYGVKRVGLAISDDGGKIAFPYKVIQNNLELVDAIHNICGEENISVIVLGESLDSSGNKNKVMGSIEELKKNLEIELDLPVDFEKEFMTSVHSGEQKFKNIFIARKIKISSAKASAYQRKDDSKAAALILQRYLDRKNNKQ